MKSNKNILLKMEKEILTKINKNYILRKLAFYFNEYKNNIIFQMTLQIIEKFHLIKFKLNIKLLSLNFIII